MCVCVRACVRVCDTGVFYFTGFPWVFFSQTSASKALWEGGYCPDGFFLGVFICEKC